MRGLSIVRGLPLDEEPGIGVLTMPGYLRETTSRFAKHEVLVYRTADAVERWSYETLWQRAHDVARALIACGVGKDCRVGILMTNRPEFLAAVFGTTLAGGVAVVLNTFSTAPELEHLMRMSGVSLVLFERHVAAKDFATMLVELEPGIATAKPGQLISLKFPFLRRLVKVDRLKDAASPDGAIETWQEFLKYAKATPPELVEATAAATKPADVGVIFFSSGTTSMPKGIVHAHRAVALQWWRWPRVYSTRGDVRCWTANGFFWSGNFSLIIGSAMSAGGSIVLQSMFNAEEALELWQAERVTMPVASPHQRARLEAAKNFATVDLSSVHYIDKSWPLAQHPTIKTDWHMPVSYGTTETLTINTNLPAATPLEDIAASYGRPLAGNTLKIIDSLTGEAVPIGERGEVIIKGPTLMLGYLGKAPEECFDAEGFYRTGDAGYVDETGRLYFEGRLTDIIKTGGANVSPLEIDEVIRNYPGVKVCQTVGVPHDTLGEMVVSCIVPHDGVTLGEAGLRDFLKERLASYKIPRRVLYFRDEELAMTGSAKVKAGALRELAAKRLADDKSDTQRAD